MASSEFGRWTFLSRGDRHLCSCPESAKEANSPYRAVEIESPIMVAIYFLYLSALSVALYVVSSIRAILRPGLRRLPGPFLARFSGLYRLSMVAGGRAPGEYQKIHEKYGRIVRVGPNHVSISDPSMIPLVYGIGSKFLKVSRVV
jgi:hypothetical protein